jgi:hypothetical protein
MPTKSEKEAHKALRADLAAKQQREFYESLPMADILFADLFDFLDGQLSETECDHEMTHTKAWLEANCPENADAVLAWLADHGGYCDCEVLMNVEEYFR